MTHPYKTREGGATVTIFVPYDCRNHCPFCVNKQEYAHAEGFSVEAILKSIAVMDEITPRCDFVFTGGEPFANLKALQRMLDAIPTTHKVYINTTFPVQPGCSAEEMIAFTERNRDKITCINISRHLTKYVEESPDEVVARIATPKRVNCVLYMDYPPTSLWTTQSAGASTTSPCSSATTTPRRRPRTSIRRRATRFWQTLKALHLQGPRRLPHAQRLPLRLQGPAHDLP